MAQAATDDVGSLVGMADVVGKVGGADDLSIGIHEEEPIIAGLVGEEVAYAGTTHIVTELDEAAVGEMRKGGVALAVGSVGRGIVGHDNLIGHTELLGLQVEVAHQARTVVLVCRDEYREHKMFALGCRLHCKTTEKIITLQCKYHFSSLNFQFESYGTISRTPASIDARQLYRTEASRRP